MRNELLAWFAREGLLLQDVTTSAEDPEHDEIKVSIKAPILALSRASEDFRECPDPVLFGYPASSLDMMNLDDFHQFVYQWFERAVAAGIGRCFVCNKVLETGSEVVGQGRPLRSPWDAIFITSDMYCWLLMHFDCKRSLGRDLKGRNPFEVTSHPPEFFDLRLT